MAFPLATSEITIEFLSKTIHTHVYAEKATLSVQYSCYFVGKQL